MKSKKVLFGLILAAFVGTAGISSAQTKANFESNQLIEIGPDNIGGRVRAIIADQSDPQHKTLFAGGVAGGLYKWSNGASSWEFVPYQDAQGKQVTLPISHMVQTPNDNMIYIATGEGMAVGENANSSLIVPDGRGLFRFNPANNSFELVSGTQTWKHINRLAFLYRNNTLHFYAATNQGLYRWAVSNGAAWGTPTQVFAGPVQDIEIVSGDNMAFFTSGSHLYKISNVTSGNASYSDISSSCPAFGGDALRIELAAAKSDKTYLYAMVANKSGLLEGVYLTHNQQQWTKLTPPTTTPFTADNNGWHNNTITVDPQNHKRIIIGGATIWEGQGYVENSLYQWTMASYSEDYLGAFNYMENVYPSPIFVHSGIHEILPVPEIAEGGDTTWTYYIATDGGIFKTTYDLFYFHAMNQGFNTVQYNGIAIAPDGSILGGAMDNSCPFIQSRHDHYNGNENDTWYDHGSTRNHLANIYWMGNGGQVEASMFEQVAPSVRRGLFFSSNGTANIHMTSQGTLPVAAYGRAYDDYNNYTNTQTWTYDTNFVGTSLGYANDIANMALFETTNNQGFDSVTFNIDTLGTIIRNGVEISFRDTAYANCAANFQVKAGDQIYVGSKAHFGYPFLYTFTNDFKLGDNLTHSAHNPLAARLFLSAKKATNQGCIRVCLAPSDYSKLCTGDRSAPVSSKLYWYELYKTMGGAGKKYETTGQLAPSNNGDAIFFEVIDTLGEQHYMLRVANINACNLNDPTNTDVINWEGIYEGMPRITTIDTIFFNGANYRINRPITCIAVDPREGKDMVVVALGGNDANTPNLYIINNANNPATRTVTAKTVEGGRAIYSALVEMTTGNIMVGTDNGVFVANAGSYNEWNAYGDFAGVPVTSIRQQTKSLPTVRYTTHSGINEERHIFAKTKFPGAIYFGTYGRGVFMNMEYVTDTVNEVVDSEDFAGITTVDNGLNSISIFPNPATSYANIDMTVVEGGNATINVYDINGKLVYTENLGRISEGNRVYRLDTQNFRHGMYLVNVNIGSKAATSKLIVR